MSALRRLPMSLAIVALSSLALALGTSAQDVRVAEHNATPIALGDVGAYHCHDVEYPVIRCFDSAQERDEDAQFLVDSGTSSSDGPSSVTAVNYVVWYEHINYGGASYLTSVAWPNLGDIGWANRISSFKSLNSGRPKWWSGTSYSGTSWQWAAGAQVSYVGDGANDQFSSVKNVP